MSEKFRLRSLIAVLGTLLILMTAAAATGASGTLNVRDPERPRLAGEAPPLAAPMLRPPPGVTYTPQALNSPAIYPDSRPVAQLAAAPVDMQDTAIFLPTTLRIPGTGEVSFAILSSIRYSGNSHHLYVSTVRPSASAAQGALGLGNETVRLADGATAWATTGLAGDAPNRVAMVREGVIVAIEGDLPVDTLKAQYRLDKGLRYSFGDTGCAGSQFAEGVAHGPDDTADRRL